LPDTISGRGLRLPLIQHQEGAMAFLVEDGSGLVLANSPAEVVDADAYHAERANENWSGSDADKQAALIRGTAFVDATFGARFTGRQTYGRNQGLTWPRYPAYDREGAFIQSDELPKEYLNACFEAALRELVTPGVLSPDINSSDRLTVETIGPLSFEYALPTSSDDMRVVATMIEELLRPILRGGGTMTQFLLRA
jgi:hypothetical protein